MANAEMAARCWQLRAAERCACGTVIEMQRQRIAAVTSQLRVRKRRSRAAAEINGSGVWEDASGDGVVEISAL